MSEPEEPFIIPMASKGLGSTKWVALGAAVVVALLGGWLAIEYLRDQAAAEQAAEEKRAADEADEKRREQTRRQAGSGIPLSEAHKPPPGWKPPKSRIPSRELFGDAPLETSSMLPTRLPGGLFGIQLPATWDTSSRGGLLLIRAPEDHFRIIVATGSQTNDGNTKQAIDEIGAVNCNWRHGDGPRRGQIGSQHIPAFFNEGVCGHTDGYGLIWILRLYAGDDVVSLVARYSASAGEDAEEVLIRVLRSVVPVE